MNQALTTDQRFEQCATAVQGLLQAVQQLQRAAVLLQTDPVEATEWHQLLRQKLAPQLGQSAFLAAAVVGGTNIGKSVIFNHLAGSPASAVSPLASGTKHPTCLLPAGFQQQHSLQAIFPDFELRPWSSADQTLQETEQNLLFWRESGDLPESLLLLDTPDIDSDARTNWLRADAVRRCADVLIAVLTQQKYNDAAVKEFFRRAAREGRTVIVVFNQVLLPEDEPYWPIWLQTFCDETGLRPETVYLAPADRRAAESLRLPFFERRHACCAAGASGESVDPTLAVNPAQHLARLRFAEIRLKTLQGSLQELLHPERGAGGWLRELQRASATLQSAAARLTQQGLIQVRGWPVPPAAVAAQLLQDWWGSRRTGWARSITSAYAALNVTLLWPVRAARKALQSAPDVPPLEEYAGREWSVIVSVVEDVFQRLQVLADGGSPLIRARLQSLLEPAVRGRLLERLRVAHGATDLQLELRQVVDQQMEHAEAASPEVFRLCRHANNLSAAVRPVTSVVLFSLGFGPAGDLVAPLLGQAAAAALVHAAVDVAGGATAAIAGEAAVAAAAGSGAGLLQAWFHQLQASFAARRGAWLAEFLKRELLGDLPDELQRAAGLANSDEFLAVQRSLQQLAIVSQADA